MDINLTSEEKTLVEHAKEAVVKYNTIRLAKGDIDTLYGFVLSDSGTIYDGACYEPQPTICGERHAIANMVLQESNKAKITQNTVSKMITTEKIRELSEKLDILEVKNISKRQKLRKV